MPNPEVETTAEYEMQICVPNTWTTGLATAFANKENPATTAWRISTKDLCPEKSRKFTMIHYTLERAND